MEAERTDTQVVANTVRAHSAVRDLIRLIGEDPSREGLKGTPDRVIRSYQELYAGYRMDPADILSKTFRGDGYDQMVVLKNIEMFSTCEHHILPFHGTATVAYIPSKRVVGLSKLARVVECFSRRLQIQERLTNQIADALMIHLEPRGCGVMIEAQHMCMVARGVKKSEAQMVTSALRGVFIERPEVRAEFMGLSG